MGRKARLSKSERLEAMLAAEKMLAERFHDDQVVRALQGRYECSVHQARGVLRSVYDRWEQESAERRSWRREQQIRSLEDLYREARKAKKFHVCVRIETLLARIEGTLEPDRMLVMGGRDDDFETRTEAELDHYIAHGCWPEESPRTAKANGGGSGSDAVH